MGLLFDTKGVREDVKFIHNRVWAERSLPSSSGRGAGGEGERTLFPILEMLHHAYQEAWVDEMLNIGRKLRK